MKISVQKGKKDATVTLSNSQNTHQFYLTNHDMRDFKWYRDTAKHRTCLAVYLTAKNAKAIGKRCKLFTVSRFSEFGTMIFPFIKGFLCCPFDRWFIVQPDNRNFKRLVKASCDNDDIFKHWFRPTTNPLNAKDKAQVK